MAKSLTEIFKKPLFLSKEILHRYDNDVNDFVQVIAAEGEQKASRALKEASDIISESPSALQLR